MLDVYPLFYFACKYTNNMHRLAYVKHIRSLIPSVSPTTLEPSAVGNLPDYTNRPTRRPSRKPTRRPSSKPHGDWGWDSVASAKPTRRPSSKPHGDWGWDSVASASTSTKSSKSSSKSSKGSKSGSHYVGWNGSHSGGLSKVTSELSYIEANSAALISKTSSSIVVGFVILFYILS